MKIALFGTVGAGKSTIANKISEYLGYKIISEPIDDNPYFLDSYKDMKNNGFKMQVYMLTERSKQLISANNLKDVIFDRTLLEDPIFVAAQHDLQLFNDIDFKTYNDFYEYVIIPTLAQRNEFDLLIYLKVTTNKAIERIKLRGREYELNVPKEYWERLNHRYDDFFEKRKHMFDNIVIDANTDNIEEIVNTIIKEIEQKEMTLKNKNS